MICPVPGDALDGEHLVCLGNIRALDARPPRNPGSAQHRPGVFGHKPHIQERRDCFLKTVFPRPGIEQLGFVAVAGADDRADVVGRQADLELVAEVVEGKRGDDDFLKAAAGELGDGVFEEGAVCGPEKAVYVRINKRSKLRHQRCLPTKD